MDQWSCCHAGGPAQAAETGIPRDMLCVVHAKILCVCVCVGEGVWGLEECLGICWCLLAFVSSA